MSKLIAKLLIVSMVFVMSTLSCERSSEQNKYENAMSESPNNSAEEENGESYSNHLAGETSPYLLQHVHNPVDWYPWGEEAITRAKQENKPIFLSIGYSACHWCHVMERESFEDPEIAKVLNTHFISIKVDREERPDLDEIYMTAVQMMTGGGGWPLSVFLTPDLKPFFGGTYFPPVDYYGRPGFKKLVERIAEIWREKPDEIRRNAEKLTQVIQSSVEQITPSSGELDVSVLSNAVDFLEKDFDSIWGGFGQAPKFPPSGAIAVLFRQYKHTGDKKILEMATKTLDRMAYGGMYDQLGGGFHRYSTDIQWLVPHFEKMLYDNALLGRTYLEAWQVTHKELYRRIAEEIFDYVLRDMTDRRGGFCSSEDADSEGEEGKFYVWRRDEILKILGEEDGTFFCEYYGVTEEGNFEEHNVLNVKKEPEKFAREKNLSIEELEKRLARLRRTLREERDKRVRPGKDDKVLAAWNGMMISALARGYQILGEERFLKAAEGAADFVLTVMVRDGLLLRTYRDRSGGKGKEDGKAKLPAYLDDYAEMAYGLIDLYEATFDLRWLEAADELARRMVKDFYDEEHEGFFFTTSAHKNLLVRTKPYYDGAVPSGNSAATLVLLRLWKLLDNATYYEKAQETLFSARGIMLAQPRAYLNLLSAADFFFRPTQEIAIAGERGGSDTKRFLDFIHDRFIPNKVLALLEPETSSSDSIVNRIPLLSGKTKISGKTAVYVCENYACKKPVTDTEALGKLLGGN